MEKKCNCGSGESCTLCGDAEVNKVNIARENLILIDDIINKILSFATNLDSETYSMLANAVSAYTQESEQLCSDCIIDQIVKDLAELRARL